MKFKINYVWYEIIEIEQKEYKEFVKQRNEKQGIKDDTMENGIYFGATHNDINKIYLDKNLTLGRKRKTLIHELTHTFINNYITHEDKIYNEEEVADIVSNSFDFINDIVNLYFKER